MAQEQDIFVHYKNELSVCEPQAADYLTRKYNRAFTVLGVRGACWGIPDDRFWAKPDGGGDDTVFAVFGSPHNNGCVFADAYYSVLIKPEYEAFVNKLASEVLPQYKLRLTLNRESPNPDGLVGGVPVTEINRYIQPSGPLFCTRVTLFTPQSSISGANPADLLLKVAKGLADAKLMAWLKMYTITDADYDSGAVDVENAAVGAPVVCYTGRDYVARLYSAWQVTTLEAAAPQALLNDQQLERLCALVYLDGLLLHKDEGTVGEIVDYLLAYGFDDCKISGKLPCEMTESEWLRVLRDILRDKQLSVLRIIKTVDVTEATAHAGQVLPGHRCVAFYDGIGTAYAVFRGTCGDEEWYDNAQGMIQSDTTQQLASAQFVVELKQMRGVNQVVTAGHSKGGNKAQYAAVTTPEGYVNYCFALDGQGFSQAFMDKYADAIKARKSFIRLLAERRDFVNCLGFYVTEGTRFHTGRRGDAIPGMPYGNPLPYFHCPDALRDTNGRLGLESADKPIPEAFNQLVTYFLTAPTYDNRRKETAVDLIALLMKNKRASTEETAAALVNLITVFMDLVSENRDFRDRIEAVIFQETHVLLATFDNAAAPRDQVSDAENQDSLAKCVAECLKRRILTEPIVRKNFIKTLKHTILLIKKMVLSPHVDKKILDYIFAFIEDLLMRLAGAAVHKTLAALLACWRAISGHFKATRLPAQSNGYGTQLDAAQSDDLDFSVLLAQLEQWEEEK